MIGNSSCGSCKSFGSRDSSTLTPTISLGSDGAKFLTFTGSGAGASSDGAGATGRAFGFRGTIGILAGVFATEGGGPFEAAGEMALFSADGRTAGRMGSGIGSGELSFKETTGSGEGLTTLSGVGGAESKHRSGAGGEGEEIGTSDGFCAGDSEGRRFTVGPATKRSSSARPFPWRALWFLAALDNLQPTAARNASGKLKDSLGMRAIVFIVNYWRYGFNTISPGFSTPIQRFPQSWTFRYPTIRRRPYHSANFRVPNQSPARAIVHLDMDCFYAAIEVRDRPALRGKPVGVGGARDRRGVLTTCNYEARKFGVHSAMPTFMALQRCPQLIVLPTRFDVYRREASVVRGILHRFTHLVEPLSLDEAYLDVTAHPDPPAQLASQIRKLILEKTRLTASAGIGPNKLVAKIASEINKPNGQLEVKPEEVAEFVRPLPVRKIWGIGEKTEQKLVQLGIHTCAELQRLSRIELQELFGKFGVELFDLCRGIDDRPVEPDRPRKSLSTEETFPIDLINLTQCQEKLDELYQELMADLAQKETSRSIRKIFVKLKFNDFTRTTAERAGLGTGLQDFRTLLAEAYGTTGKPVRLIGIGVRFAEELATEAQMPLL